MEETSTEQVLGGLGIIVTAIAGVIIALISRWRSPGDTGAVKASTVLDLSNSIDVLGKALDRERGDRLDDCLEFDVKVAELSESFNRRVAEIEAHNSIAIDEIRDRNRAEIEALKTFYESKISRIEQAHRDRVESLKRRIKALENANGDKPGNAL